jgi:GxxExxY protein
VVFCDDVIVGEYTADLIVEDQVIVELKVVGALSDVHVPQ